MLKHQQWVVGQIGSHYPDYHPGGQPVVTAPGTPEGIGHAKWRGADNERVHGAAEVDGRRAAHYLPAGTDIYIDPEIRHLHFIEQPLPGIALLPLGSRAACQGKTILKHIMQMAPWRVEGAEAQIEEPESSKPEGYEARREQEQGAKRYAGQYSAVAP